MHICPEMRWGQYLVYDDVYIVCENESYGVYKIDDNSLTDTIVISQNDKGIDTEDRIFKLKKYVAKRKKYFHSTGNQKEI